MTNLETNQLAGWIGHDAVDADGDSIGEIVDIYADDVTGQPEWLAIRTGMFGRKISFVPISGATDRNGALCVSWQKEHVKNAPHAEPDGALSPDEEAALYAHYDMSSLGADVRGTADMDTTST